MRESERERERERESERERARGEGGKKEGGGRGRGEKGQRERGIDRSKNLRKRFIRITKLLNSTSFVLLDIVIANTLYTV